MPAILPPHSAEADQTPIFRAFVTLMNAHSDTSLDCDAALEVLAQAARGGDMQRAVLTIAQSN